MTDSKPSLDARCPECNWTPGETARTSDQVREVADALQAHFEQQHGYSAAEARSRAQRWALFAVDEVTQVDADRS